jgi:outer membrane lipoprotein-sorting protein
MKTLKTLFIFLLAIAPIAQAQTADEIITAYFENTGGVDAWGELEGVKMTASANAQGMEIPVTIYQMKDGRQIVKINLQGQEITQFAFDGETMWGQNFMTGEAEKSDAETTANMKQTVGDFPNPFYDYADRGYKVELLGKETKEGTETYKIKLTQKPVMVDGIEKENVSYHYFDTENMVIIASESEANGQMATNTMSDYQEVDGLYFPFDMGMVGQNITIKEIELNPEVTDEMFTFPEKK